MICTSECVKDVHMDGYILLGRGKVLIMSDSDCTRTFVWNISVWRRTRFVPFIFSLHDQLLQYFYQFLTENIKFNSSWFPSTWWFPVSFFFFQMLTRKKNVSRDTMILRCFHHGQNLVTKCATSVSLMRTGEVNNTLNSEIAREWVNTLSILFNKCKAKISGLL